MPAAELDAFVSALAHRIAGFPGTGHAVVKDRVNAIALAPVADLRRDSDLFGEAARGTEFQNRTAVAMRRGFQTREAELSLPGILGER